MFLRYLEGKNSHARQRAIVGLPCSLREENCLEKGNETTRKKNGGNIAVGSRRPKAQRSFKRKGTPRGFRQPESGKEDLTATRKKKQVSDSHSAI